MKIGKKDYDFFQEYLKRLDNAFKEQKIIITYAEDNETKKPAALLCHVDNNTFTGKLEMKPLASLFNYDPFQRFTPILVDGNHIIIAEQKENKEIKFFDKKMLN